MNGKNLKASLSQLESIWKASTEPYSSVSLGSSTLIVGRLVPISHCPQLTLDAELLPNEKSQFRIPFTLRGTPAIGHFVPRPEELEDMERCLLQYPTPNKRKVFVLHGLGGIGKTQLALEFARTHKNAYTAIFWLHGDTLDSLKLSLAEAASWVRRNSWKNTRLGSGEGGDGVDVLSKEGLDWLSQEDNDRWLLIYDNCDTLITEDNGYELLSMFPTADHGSIIITTRRNQLSSLGNSQKMLQRMNETQSITLLENNIGQEFIINDTSIWDRKCGCRHVRFMFSDVG
jgi:hypothetical protein